MQVFGGPRTTNGSAAPFRCEQGSYLLAATGTFGGATVTFEIDFSETGLWMPVPNTMLATFGSGGDTASSAFTASGAVFVAVPSGSRLRATVSSASGATSVVPTIDRFQGLPQRADG